MSVEHQVKAIILIWCIVIPSMFITFAASGAGWMRLLPALIMLVSAAAATAILYPTQAADEARLAGQTAESWTPREREVLALIAEGCTNEEIASCLVVALSTVKTHVNNIYRKLGARNRVQAVAYARALGLI